jgi:hypothetical protein
MQQQTSSSQQDSSDEAPRAPQQEAAQRDPDGTWGLGSATALDSLRRQGFRGKRHPPADDRPVSH